MPKKGHSTKNLAQTHLAFMSRKTFPRNDTQKDVLCHRLAISIVLMVTLSASLNVFADTKCSPFGDPQAQVDRGWFASFVAAHSSACPGGALLGPWADGNGDARYACL